MIDSSEHDSSKAIFTMIEAAIRLGLLLLLAAWCFLIVTPFVLPIMWGIIIAVAVFPLFAKLKSALGGSNKLAATVYTLIAVALLITPTLMISGSLVDTAQVLVDKYEQGTLTVSPPDESVKDWPVIGEKVSDIWTQASNNLDTTVDKYRPQLKQISEKVVATATSTGVTVLIFIVSVIISGVLMANASGAYNFTVRLFSRLMNDQQGVAYTNLSRDTIRSIAQGVLGIAVIQATMGGIGMYVMDVPAWGLWTLLILGLAICQLPPLLVLGFVIVYVFSVADTTPAIIFMIYAMFVSVSDTFLKPLLLGRGVSTPMLVVLIGAIGGMILDGVIGLFVGAVVLALGYELFMAWLAFGEKQKHEG
jgi:predicted PurR-regulated permease PerM